MLNRNMQMLSTVERPWLWWYGLLVAVGESCKHLWWFFQTLIEVIWYKGWKTMCLECHIDLHSRDGWRKEFLQTTLEINDHIKGMQMDIWSMSLLIIALHIMVQRGLHKSSLWKYKVVLSTTMYHSFVPTSWHICHIKNQGCLEITMGKEARMDTMSNVAKWRSYRWCLVR